MHKTPTDFFSQPTSPKGEPKKTSEEKSTQKSSQEKETRSTERGATVLGKYYSFQGEDKPIYCRLISATADQLSAHLDYAELKPSGKSATIYSAFENHNTLYLSITLNTRSEVPHTFERLNTKSVALGITPEIIETAMTTGIIKSYRYIGAIDKIKQLFPILADTMFADRYATHKDTLCRLADIWQLLYDESHTQYLAQQPTPALRQGK